MSISKYGNRGTLSITKQLSVRMDSLIVEILNKQAEECNISLAEYVRILLVDHAVGVNAVNEIKKDIKQIVDFTNDSYKEINTLKQQIKNMEGDIKTLKLLQVSKNTEKTESK